MKTKSILIICAIAVVLVAGVAFFVSSQAKPLPPTSSDVTMFLLKLQNATVDGDEQTIAGCFKTGNDSIAMAPFIELLAGIRDPNGGKPLAYLNLGLERARIKDSSGMVVDVIVPVELGYQNLATKKTVLMLQIEKVGPDKMLVRKAGVRQFLADYSAYENKARSSRVIFAADYTSLTNAAFRAAKQLTGKYDSILWFDHVNRKTWYYVTNGTFNFYKSDSIGKRGYKPAAKMGLVGPDMREIIPARYDLVHNIGGMIDGLVEVEKDGRRGFYDLNGKIIVPVTYDQAFPLTGDQNLALLRKNEDYYFLRKDFSISEKIRGLNITGIMPQIKGLGKSFTLSVKNTTEVMEWNSYDMPDAIVITPGYLADLNIFPSIISFQNPMRKGESREGAINVKVHFKSAKKENPSWFSSAFYSIVDHYVDGRTGFYSSDQASAVLVADEKQKRILGYRANVNYAMSEEDAIATPGLTCNENYLRAINDSLFEYKASAYVAQPLPVGGLVLGDAPVYHYLHVRSGRLVADAGMRLFACTHFVKMDDSYLAGCFNISGKGYDRATPEVIAYMKNEIYASYRYKFKDDGLNKIFVLRFARHAGKLNASVDDSLTAIDKYNIKWLDSKLRTAKSDALASR